MALVVRINGDSSGFNKAMNDFNRQVNGLSKDWGRLGKEVTAIGKGLTKALTVPLVALGGASVVVAASFEQSMSKVATTVGDAGDNMEELTRIARHWGRNSVFNADQVAEAMSQMGLAGLNTKDIYGAMPATIALAQSANMGLADATSQVTGILNTFNLEGIEATRVADLLTSANKTANTTVSEMAQVLGNAAPALATYGIELDDAVLATTLMADASLTGAVAGTSLRNMINDLARACRDGNVEMSRMGISFHDAEGMARPLTDVLRDVRYATQGMNEVELGNFLSNIGLTQSAVAGLTPILSAADERFDYLVGRFDDASGAAQHYANIMGNNLKAEMKIFWNNIRDIGITLGDVLLPAIRDIAQRITDLARTFAENLTPEMAEVIVKIGVFLAVIGPMLVIVGKVITAFGKLKATLKVVKSGFLFLKAPIVAVVALVVGLTSVLFRHSDVLIGVIRNNEGFWQTLRALAEAFPILTGAIVATTIAFAGFKVIKLWDSAMRIANKTAILMSIQQNAMTASLKASTTALVGKKLATHTVGAAMLVLTGKVKASVAIKNLWSSALAKNTLLQNAWTIATKLAALGASGLAAVNAVLTGNTVALTAAKVKATVAMAALNKVMLLNPIGLIVAGVAALVGLGTALFAWFSRGTAESRRMNEEQERLVENIDNLNDGISNSGQAFDKQRNSISNNANANNRLADEVMRLSQMENKSAEDRMRLQLYIDRLNGSMEGLNLTYNEQTGVLSMTEDAIRSNISALEDKAKAAAAQERLTEILSEQMEVEFKLSEVNRLRQEWNKLSEEGGRKARGHRNAISELDEQYYELMNTQYGLARRYEYTAGIAVEAHMRMTEANETTSESALENAQTHQEAFELMSEAQQEVVEKMAGRWEQYRDQGQEMFSQISESAKLHTMVMDENGNAVEVSLQEMGATAEEVMEHMVDNMRANREAMQNWSGNLATIGEHTSADFVEHLRGMGPEGAWYVEQLATLSAAELQEMQAEFDLAGHYATDNLTNALGEGSEEAIAMAESLASGIESGLADQLSAADFLGMGESVGEGVAQGIDNSGPRAVDSTEAMADDIDSCFRRKMGIRSPSRVFRGYGVNIIGGLVQGLSNAKAQAVNFMITLTRDLRNAMRSTPSDFRTIGLNAMQGLNQGLLNGRSAVLNTARQTAQMVSSTMRDALRINSPSKVMADEVGQWIPKGIAKGIESNYDSIERALKFDIPKMSNGIFTDFDGILALSNSQANLNISSNAPFQDSTTINNQGLFEGAHFYIQSENDARVLSEQLNWLMMRQQGGLA